MRAISLPMYDLPFLRAATDAWAAGLALALAHEGIAGAAQTRTQETGALWRSPDLLVSQSCGYPLMTDFAGDLIPLATPRYRAAGCAGTDYVSFIVVRADAARELADLRGTTLALNDWRSHSGMNALRRAVAPLARDGRFFSEIKISGSHLNSVALVAKGEADVAAVDCVTHALIARHAPALLAGLRILAATRPAPSLPYVTRADAPMDRIKRLTEALHRAAADSGLAAVRDDLLLDGFAALPASAYAPMLTMETEAVDLGYPALA